MRPRHNRKKSLLKVLLTSSTQWRLTLYKNQYQWGVIWINRNIFNRYRVREIIYNEHRGHFWAQKSNILFDINFSTLQEAINACEYYRKKKVWPNV